MKILKKSTENFHFYSREKSLYVAWACFRNGEDSVRPESSLFAHWIARDFSFSHADSHNVGFVSVPLIQLLDGIITLFK